MYLTLFTYLTIVSCYGAHRMPHDDKHFPDIIKQQVDSAVDRFILKRSSALARIKSTVTPNTTSIQTTPPKKWQVERVTRKHYEIINLLWRKTNIFVNDESTTPKHKQDNITKKMFDLNHQYIFSSHPPIPQSVTPSYIEFYYSYDTDPKNPMLTRTRNKKSYSKSSIYYIPRFFTDFRNGTIHSPNIETKSSLVSSSTNEESYTKTILSNCKTLQTESKQTERKNQIESTTLYDKIKFFELYDKHTRVPFTKKVNDLDFQYSDSTTKMIESNNVSDILLEDVDQSDNEHNETKHPNKSIVGTGKNSSESCFNRIEGNILNVTTERSTNPTSYVTNKSHVQSNPKEYNYYFSYVNKSVSWSDYPFAAVYVYEQAQVHCDAASISAHWLVASGSCLSRLKRSPVLGTGRSAFVAYCGDSWWQPERVSYVKKSVVHPWYHPRDWTRRHLYNIGVIQVVTSMMSACSGWAPVSFMSHLFTARREGTVACALGWGLDRYDTRYAATDLPKASLMVYEGLVFLNSCPGHFGYGKVKRFVEGGGGVKNVYCLSLPPYSGEEHDPIHGSLLLVDGKLTALYLQEERRSQGVQSAQYTGIWRLISWVMEVATEPEIELLAIDI